jgi:2-polyprenyl-3-methyl-5-hydroxy-6-metoxy-1,4-benzoquinol methylase
MGIISGASTNTSKIINDRIGLIKEYCIGKNVLDVGCVDHQASEEVENPFWLHKIIQGVAKRLVGVDFEQKEVDILNAKGYRVVWGNVETVNLQEEFDVIVAGELIEHVSNAGKFLENMHKHLIPGGVLIITTPNAFAVRYHVTHFTKGMGSSNMQHTYYFDYFTLKELCSRYPFEIIETYYFFDTSENPIKQFLNRLIVKFRKSYAPRILFVLRKK